MSNRLHPPVVAKGRGIKKVIGRFKPNGGSAITNTVGTTVFGARGWSVARSGTGQFTLTIADTYQLLLHASFTLWSASILGGVFRVVSVTYNTTSTVVVFEHLAEGSGTLAAANIASADDHFVSFELTFQDAKVQNA